MRDVYVKMKLVSENFFDNVKKETYTVAGSLKAPTLPLLQKDRPVTARLTTLEMTICAAFELILTTCFRQPDMAGGHALRAPSKLV